MSMTTPNHITDNVMTVIKGWYDLAALDFSAKLAAAVTITAHGGRVVHLNSSGEFEMGIANTQMAIFLNQGSDHPDVRNPGITGSGGFMHVAVSPGGAMSGVVATGGYEIATSQFETSPTRAYAPNQLLTAVAASNTSQAVSGVLSNDRNGAGGSGGAVRQYVDAACGVVSRGQSVNEHGSDILTFWTIYLPAAA